MAEGIIYGAYMRSSEFSYFPKRLNNALMSIKKDQNTHVTRADKSNVIVLLDKADYVEKMHQLLDDENTYEKLISNPLERVNDTIIIKFQS